MSAEREAAEVLGAHADWSFDLGSDAGSPSPTCDCGQVLGTFDDMCDDLGFSDALVVAAHHAHVAHELVAALAAAAGGREAEAFLDSLPTDLFSETEVKKLRDWAAEWSAS